MEKVEPEVPRTGGSEAVREDGREEREGTCSLGRDKSLTIGDHATSYFETVDIYEYDETIVAHPLMDQVKSAICERIVLRAAAHDRTSKVLDLGCGSGQLARSLLGLSNVEVHLSDCDPDSRTFCSRHPELGVLPFHAVNLLHDDGVEALRKVRFDSIVILGVLHHVPPLERARFIANCARVASHVVLADEGLAPYADEAERCRNAEIWYNFVIAEAKRRGLDKLAALEESFKKCDISTTRQVTDDYKTSLEEVLTLVDDRMVDRTTIKRIGDWPRHRGGMYVVDICFKQPR
jgi:SAM-dependent methyltransferase